MGSRPKVHFSGSDWSVQRLMVSEATQEARLRAFQARQESHWMRNDSKVARTSEASENEHRLSQRVDQVQEWRRKLQRQLTDVDAELEALGATKRTTEQALQAAEVYIQF